MYMGFEIYDFKAWLSNFFGLGAIKIAFGH
jgi:hypothetical protein